MPRKARVTLESLLEYAGQRLADGDHLAREVIEDVEEGMNDVRDVMAGAARREAFLTLYLADCYARLSGAAK